jgi:hypothetical protein
VIWISLAPIQRLARLIGNLLATGGYGATFFLLMHFRSNGGNDLDTVLALVEATGGTLVGVPLFGWLAQRIPSAFRSLRRTSARIFVCSRMRRLKRAVRPVSRLIPASEFAYARRRS